MKKNVFLAIVFILLFVSLTSAAKYKCSNETDIERDVKEIKLGYVKYFNGISVGNIYSREIPAIGKIEAELILEAQRLTLSLLDKTKEEIELSVGKIIVELTKIQNENVSLKVGGTSGNLERRVYQKVGSFDVFVSEVYPDLNKTELIVGNKKIYLSNNGLENYKTKIKNDTFLVEIESASSNNVIIGVSKCENADIIQINENRNISVGNGTITNATTQTSIINDSQNGTEIQNNSVNISLIKKDIRLSCWENSECLSNLCHRGKCVKRYFFDNIIEWIKNLF